MMIIHDRNGISLCLDSLAATGVGIAVADRDGFPIGWEVYLSLGPKEAKQLAESILDILEERH